MEGNDVEVKICDDGGDFKLIFSEKGFREAVKVINAKRGLKRLNLKIDASEKSIYFNSTYINHRNEHFILEVGAARLPREIIIEEDHVILINDKCASDVLQNYNSFDPIFDAFPSNADIRTFMRKKGIW